MKVKSSLITLAASLLILSCDQKRSFETLDSPSAEMAADSIISSVAATVQDKNKQFIHTADINLDVKDVFSSTLSIEKNVLAFGGYVTKSNLQSYIISNHTVPVSKDSSRETKVYKVNTYMEVRVPQSNLNEFLLSLNKEIDFLNSRLIEANEVTFQVKALDLNQKRLENTEEKLDKALEQEGKIKDKHTIINSLNSSQSEKDQTAISKEILQDKIKLATVTIALQEKEKIKQTIIPNTQDSDLYTQSNFGYQAKVAFLSGVDMFQSVIISLFYIWPFWLILLAGFVLYRKYKKKKVKL